MKTGMLVRSVALAMLGAIAASRPQPALADLPPLDFPPSCLSWLNDGYFVNAPEGTVGGFAQLPANGAPPPELVSFWRVSCGGGEAALQMRLGFWDPIDDPQVSMPRLTVRQNGREEDVVALSVLYPNSPRAPVLFPAGTASSSPGMFVLSSNGTRVDLKGALTMLVRHPVTGEVLLSEDIPAYPSALLPINGRLVGNFYDPEKSGEGIIVEIGDFGPPPAGQRQRRYLQYNWFTYDNDGLPFWISGGGEFLEGDTHVHMQAIYRGGGRFAGGKAPTDLTSWGTVDMEFSDCNSLRIFYHSKAGLPANVPRGKGQLEWHRLTSVSGYTCN